MTKRTLNIILQKVQLKLLFILIFERKQCDIYLIILHSIYENAFIKLPGQMF